MNATDAVAGTRVKVTDVNSCHFGEVGVIEDDTCRLIGCGFAIWVEFENEPGDPSLFGLDELEVAR